MILSDYQGAIAAISQAVTQGVLPYDTLYQAARRVVAAKFALGMISETATPMAENSHIDEEGGR